MPRKRKTVTPTEAPLGADAAFEIPDGLLEELAPSEDPTSVDRAIAAADPFPKTTRQYEELAGTSSPAATTSDGSAGHDDEPQTLEELSRALIPLVDQLRATVADIALIPFASATPEQRTQLIRLRQQLDRPRQDLSTWVDAIDISIRIAAQDTQAKEFLLADGKVIVEPPRGEWVVNVPGLQGELKELMAHGLISQAEIDDIIVTEVVTKANNAKLNALKAKRGEAVAAAVDRWRVWKAGNPTSAKIRFERPGREDD